MERLALNGWIVYIQRDLDLLLVGNARPLSSSKEAVASLFQERKHLYQSYADIMIENNHDISAAVKQIVQEYENLEQ